jgi:hypothetical protein
MAATSDKLLVEWGSRLFYSMPSKGSRVHKAPNFAPGRISANEIRNRVRQAISPRAKQVMVKITGGGRGMAPIAAHMRYIARQGKPEVGGRGKSLELEDQDGEKISGTEEIKGLQSDWRVAGSFIEESSQRREAFNIVLSMPAGTPPEHVLDSAREFACDHFTGHKYVFVMHNDTDSPHVHLAVKAERWDGKRLNPRKADLQEWRESFAQKLQDRGIDAIATRAASRNQTQASQAIWRLKAGDKVRAPRPNKRGGESSVQSSEMAHESWRHLGQALESSPLAGDRELAQEVKRYVGQTFGTPSQRQVPQQNPGDQRPAPRR